MSRAVFLPEWEEYGRGLLDYPTAIEYHTEFYEQNCAEDAVRTLLADHNCGFQFYGESLAMSWRLSEKW